MLLLKFTDKVFGCHCAVAYQGRILESTSPDDYPKILQCIYEMYTRERLDLNHPRSFNEKIQWLKLYDTTEQKTMLADKYLVREWVREKIGDQYLVPLLGVWNSFDEIDFDSLPDSFFLKCNHGSGMNLVVRDRKSLDIQRTKRQFDNWMNLNYAFSSALELQYKDIPRKILAEEIISQSDSDLLDYKIHVFHGEPKIIQVIGDRDLARHTAKECFLTPEWIPGELMYHTYEMYDVIPEKPENLFEMLEIARILGADFRYVRVDLYNIDGRILFGEMTFTPASGLGKWKGDEQYTVGSWINLD